jgi:uncharacterized membrane protein YccC
MTSTPEALRQILRSSLRADRSRVSLDVALLITIGVAVVLVAGDLSGHPLVGVTASIGALNAGFATFQGTYRSRVGAVVAAGLATALSAFVGAVVGHLAGADVLLTALWGFAAGLVVALGQIATVVGMQAVIGLVVFSQFAFTPAVAARGALEVLAGGVVPAVLVVLVWPLRPFPAERRALGQAYQHLSDYARTVGAAPSPSLLAPAALDHLEAILADPQPLGGGTDMAAYRALADQAERIRLELAAVARDRQRLFGAGQTGAARLVAEGAAAAGDALASAAEAVKAAEVPTRWEPARDRMEAAISALPNGLVDRPAAADWWDRALLEQAAARLEALAGQLRAVVRLAAVPAGEDPVALGRAIVTGAHVPTRAARRRFIDVVRDRLAVLRANMTLSSEACRHGLRLAGTLAIAVGASLLLSLPHRYWLPMTAMLVLRPDFTATFTRGVSRIVGTLVGAGLVTLVLAELRPDVGGLTALVIVWCFAACATLFANYAVYSVCIASLVVTLLAFTGAPGASLAGERSLYTVCGAGLALIAYAVWPTWASVYLPERLAELITTAGRYGRSVLEAWAEPKVADRHALQRARLDARLARSNAEAAADRWMTEPSRRGPLSPDTALGVLASVRAYLLGILSLHARLPRSGPSSPELRDFAAAVDRAMSAAAESLRTSHRNERPVSLRAGQLALAERLGVRILRTSTGPPEAPGLPASDSEGPDPQDVLLVSETDLIANSVNTIGELLGDGARAPVHGGQPGRLGSRERRPFRQVGNLLHDVHGANAVNGIPLALMGSC